MHCRPRRGFGSRRGGSAFRWRGSSSRTTPTSKAEEQNASRLPWIPICVVTRSRAELSGTARRDHRLHFRRDDDDRGGDSPAEKQPPRSPCTHARVQTMRMRQAAQSIPTAGFPWTWAHNSSKPSMLVAKVRPGHLDAVADAGAGWLPARRKTTAAARESRADKRKQERRHRDDYRQRRQPPVMPTMPLQPEFRRQHQHGLHRESKASLQPVPRRSVSQQAVSSAAITPGTRSKKIVAERGSSSQREPPATW